MAALVLCTAVNADTKENTTMNPRNKSIIEISAYTAVSNLEKLSGAVKNGLDAGLTVNEIGEILVQSYAYVGFPRSLLAESILTSVIKEYEAQGKKLNYGESANAVPQDMDKYSYGREKINSLFGGKASQSRPETTDYNASTDIFLKEHLFTDIFYRGLLSDKERELATATMLGSLGNVNPMFIAHTTGAFRNGNSAKELYEMADLIGTLIGKKEGNNAHQVVAQVTEGAAPAAGVPSTSVSAVDIDDFASKSMFAPGVPNDAFAKYFSGRCWLNILNKSGAFTCNVTFEPGCINNWHIHHSEAQILVGVGGRGWVQIEGQEPQPINPGDVICIEPGVKHWHGAAQDSWFSHLSISASKSDGTGKTGTDWLDPVDRASYDKLR